MKEQIVDIIKEAIVELNEQLEDNEKISYDLEARLIGKNAVLDSMSFVTLITIIEELVEDKFDVSIEIVSDKAFSRTNSPFYSIQTLENFIMELMEEVHS